MRKLGGVATALAVAGLLLAIAVTPSEAVSRATRAYDGIWSVSIVTKGGPCDPSYRYPARIVDGQVTQADNDFSYQIAGVVVSSGAIAVTVTKLGQTATGYGRLRGNVGSGRWSVGGNQCYGIWNAVRRG